VKGKNVSSDTPQSGAPLSDAAEQLAVLKNRRLSLTRTLLPWVDQFLSLRGNVQFDSEEKIATVLADLAECNLQFGCGAPLSAIVLDETNRIIDVGVSLEDLLSTRSADAVGLAIWSSQLREGVHDLALEHSRRGITRRSGRLALASLVEPPLKSWGTIYYSGLYRVGAATPWPEFNRINPHVSDPAAYDQFLRDLKTGKLYYTLKHSAHERIIDLFERWRDRDRSATYPPTSVEQVHSPLLTELRRLREAKAGISVFVPWLHELLRTDFTRDFSSVREIVEYTIELSRLNALVHQTGEPFAAVIVRQDPTEHWKLAAVGVNMVRNLNFSGWHAEASCLWDFEYRGGTEADRTETQYLMVSNAQPCAQCSAHAEHAGMTKILYGASSNDVNFYMGFEEGARAVQGITAGMQMALVETCRQDACAVFSEWQGTVGRKIQYGGPVRRNR